jgi:hypothetical protein
LKLHWIATRGDFHLRSRLNHLSYGHVYKLTHGPDAGKWAAAAMAYQSMAYKMEYVGRGLYDTAEEAMLVINGVVALNGDEVLPLLPQE